MAERRKPRFLKVPLYGAVLIALLLTGCLPTAVQLPDSVLITSPSTPATTTPREHQTKPIPTKNSDLSIATHRSPLVTPTSERRHLAGSYVTGNHSGGAAKSSNSDLPLATSSPTRHSPLVTSFATLDASLPQLALPVPPPVEPLAKPDEVINILLLGNDVPWAQGGHTDSILLVSLNKKTGNANILSIPRDLYVPIPGWRMTRINLALPHGHGSGYPGGGGALVKDTILYNLGIPVDHYVRIGFSGFKEIIDGLGGVEIIENCPIEDWRLRTPDLDPEVEVNWEPFTLNPGIHQMDGNLALWYVRSRRSSNDIDRGRRQQKVIRAILEESKSPDLILDLPNLWDGFSEMFETDLTLSEVLDLAPLGLEIEEMNHILLNGEAVRPYKVPETGEAVQLLNFKEALPLLQTFMVESALHGADRKPVEVIVETNDPIMYRQVADNLLWYGFEPILHFRGDQDPSSTTITFTGSSTKGAFPNQLASIFRKEVGEIILGEESEPESAVYHIDLGRIHNPCLPYLELGEN